MYRCNIFIKLWIIVIQRENVSGLVLMQMTLEEPLRKGGLDYIRTERVMTMAVADGRYIYSFIFV